MVKQTLYDVLQVSRNADPETINAAYKSVAQRYHSDNNPDNPDAEKHLKEIDRAYEVLSDPVKRAGYDAALADDDEEQISQVNAAMSSNESKNSQPDGRAKNGSNRKGAPSFDQNDKPPLFLYIPTERLILMSIVSCGLYQSYWMYKNWRYIKERNSQSISPFLRALFSAFFCYSLLRRIHEDKEARSVQVPTFSPAWLAAGWVLLSVILMSISVHQINEHNMDARLYYVVLLLFYISISLCLVPVQNYINAVTETRNPQQQFYGWSLGHFVVLIISPGIVSLAAIGQGGYQGYQQRTAATQNQSQAYDTNSLVPASPSQTSALAEQGNAEAQYNLGVMYFNGQGMPQDYAQALLWFRKAAEQGYAAAQYNLGYMYHDGQGVPQDNAQAMMWLRKAADQGLAAAQYNLGSMYHDGQGVPKDYAQALLWFSKAADQGFAVAQYNLGYMYANGQGVPKDYVLAMMWYRKAADHGDATAQLILGHMYDKGQGVPQDYAQAMMWYRKAADHGDATAQFRLGTMYFGGEGVQADDAQAMMWYLIAKASGDTFANQSLQGLESLSTPAQIAEAQRLAREWWAAHPKKS